MNFKWMATASQYLILLGLLLVPAFVADAKSQSINLAEGRSYTLQIKSSERYPDSGTLLTDGKRGAVKDIDCGERLCAQGWVGFDQGKPVITIDLENAFRIEGVSVSFLSYPSKGVNPPTEIRLHSSFDGVHWSPRGRLHKTNMQYQRRGLDWRLRYLRIVVERDQWAFLDEIRVEGVPEPVNNQQEELKQRVLVVTSDLPSNDERRLRLINMLDGMGIDNDVIDTRQLDHIELLEYQLLIFAGSSGISPTISQTQEKRLVTAIYNGANVLWIGGGIWGSFKTTDLADAFGVRYVRQDSNETIGVRFAEYRNLDGMLERFPLKHQTMWVVKPIGAKVDSWYLDDDGRRMNIPFITRMRGNAAHGTAIFVALPLLDRWKIDETHFTYARAEILASTIRSAMSDGLVARHPVADAHDATFLLRLEDYTPGGLTMGHGTRLWMIRMKRLLELTEQYGLPLNIGIVPVYNHPYRGEIHDWGDQDPSIVLLKKMAQTAFDRGGSLITHGYDHQNGDSIDDFSGDDWETYDEDSQQFLPLALQQKITDSAYAEIEKQWGIAPTIWETPHYASNEDTFRAAYKTGFKYSTESDTKLFPNWNGHQNTANGLLLNIPETSSYFPQSAKEVKEKTLIKQLHILPRIVRMNALFLVFYHNSSENMHHALHNLLMSSRNFDLWQPSMEAFARFWENRKMVGIDAKIDRDAKQLRAVVTNAFDRFTLAIQLPADASPISVRIDGKPVEVKRRQRMGGWLVYPVLTEGVHDVTVTYR